MEKLIIFDCDGVLVDSEMTGSRIYAQALTDLGYPLTAEECIRRFTGMNDEMAHDIIFKETGIKVPGNFAELTQQVILEVFETQLNSIIFEFLKEVAEYEVARCVASSSPRNRVIRTLELTQQMQFFTQKSVFTSQQVQKGKPAPDLFLFAAKQMGYDPKNCIVIEDSVAGIEAALAAKMHVIGFLGGGHAQAEWYQNRIRSLNIPVAYDSRDLSQLCISPIALSQ